MIYTFKSRCSLNGKLAVMTSPDNAWASLTSPDMMLRMVNMTSQVSISKKKPMSAICIN